MTNEGPRTPPIQADPLTSAESEQLIRRISQLKNEWDETKEKYAELRSLTLDWFVFEPYMTRSEDLFDGIAKDIAKDSGNSKELLSLVTTIRKKFGKYHSMGKAMLGQQLKENTRIFDDIDQPLQKLFSDYKSAVAVTPLDAVQQHGVETSDMESQKIVAPQYGASAAQLAEQQQAELDSPTQSEGTSVEQAWVALDADKMHGDVLTDRTRSLVRLTLSDARGYLTYVRSRLFKLNLTEEQKAQFSDIEKRVIQFAGAVESAVSTEQSARALDVLFTPLIDTMNSLSGWNLLLPSNTEPSDMSQLTDGEEETTPPKKSRAAKKRSAVEADSNHDPEVRKFFEEEYYELRDTNKLARGADGHVMGPDEYVTAKIAELEALTPAGEVISIPDATKKEALTALQKSIGAERERLAQAPITDDAPDVDTDATAAPGTALALTGVKKRLGTLREKLTGTAPNEDVPQPSGAELYELRAKGIAEKNGMGAQFDSVRAARKEYVEARSRPSGSVSKERVARLKQEYDRALFGWRTELEQKAGALGGLERAELLVVAKRDTILGPAHADMEARERALTEKGKTAFGKVQNWMTKAPVSVLKGLNWAPTKVGEGIASVLNKEKYKLGSRMFEEGREAVMLMTPQERELRNRAAQQDAARQYARATRIIAGAGIATLATVIVSPVAGIGGVLLPFAVFTARGTAGTLAGMGGAKLGGMGFNFLNRNRRTDLKELTRTAPTTLEEYQAQQKAYLKNNARRRSNERMGTQMLSAVLVGGGTGILSSGLSHSILEQFGGLSRVKEAAKTVADVNANSPGAGPEAMRVGAAVRTASEHQPLAPAHTATVVPEASVAPKAPEVAPVSTTTAPTAPSVAGAVAKAAEAVPVRASVPSAPEGLLTSVAINKPGEGFGQLLVDLRSQVSGLQNPPAGLKHFLEQNPNTLTHRLGVADGGGSLRMHAGDKLFIDAKQNVWLQTQGQDHPTLVFQKVSVSADAPDGYRVEQLDIKKFGGELQPDAVRPRASEARVVSDAPAAPRASVPTEDPSAALNRAQVGGRALDAGTVGAQPDDVAASGYTQISPAEQVAVQAPKPPAPVETGQPVVPTSAAEQSASVAPTAPVDALPQDMTPFINSHGVNVIPSEPRVYALEGQRLVIWGTDSFKKQLDAAYAFIAEQRELGKHATVLLERTRENPFTGARETTMYEFNTDVEALKEFPPDELPIKPFGAQDFVPK